MIEVLMPRLSDSMEEGLIVTWLVEEGSEISQGANLVEIETDKATMTFEADEGGFVHIVAQEGDSLPVGATIALLLGPGEPPPAGNDAGTLSHSPAHPDPGSTEDEISPSSSPSSVVSSSKPEVESSDAAYAASSVQSASDARGRLKVSPLARRLAADRNVELGALSGSGPGGRIVRLDVKRAAEARQPGSPGPSSEEAGERGEVAVIELTRLQRVVSKRMSESKSTVPHFYLSTDVNMSACFQGRSKLKEGSSNGSVVPSFNDMVVKACALALRAFPKANGAYQDGSFELYSKINIGVAVASDEGLVVPVIHDADRLGLAEIVMKTKELAQKVRDSIITPPELSGGTFTVSNLGMFGVRDFAAVVNPGQAAILAVGAIEEKPVVEAGQLVVGKVMRLTLSCDHRILYGADGAEFLASIKTYLEEPLRLAL